MSGRIVVAVAGIGLLCSAGVAYAQPVQVETQQTPPSAQIPGFFEPSTRTFTPMGETLAAPSALQLITINAKLNIKVGKHIPSNASIHCDFYVRIFDGSFQKISNTQSLDFSATVSQQTVSTSYVYRRGGGPNLTLIVRCTATDPSGRRHTDENLALDAQPIPRGEDVTFSPTVQIRL